MKNTKIIPLAGLMILALGGTNVQAADSASGSVNLNIDVAATCVLGAPSETDINFNVDENTALLVEGAFQEVYFGDSFCNGAHVMSLTSQNDGIKTEESASLGSNQYFAQSINYTAQIQNWADSEQLSMTTTSYENNTRTQTEEIPAAQRKPGGGDALTLRVSGLTPDGSDDMPLLQGNYSDTLTLEISMAL